MTIRFRRAVRETAQTDSPAFKQWFGNSQVVDASGRPERVYHVTVYGDFDAFDKNSQRKGMAGYGFYFTDVSGVNICADYGANFQAPHDWQGNPKRINVMPVYLSLQNPLVVDHIADVKAKYGNRDPGQFGQGREYGGMGKDALTAIERDGYDGVISTEYVKRMRDGSYKVVEPGTKGAIAHPVYVVFEPTQIKSAIGNSGAFNPDSANITDSVEDEEQEVARLQAELDIATAALKTDKSNTNFRAVQRLRQQIDVAQARLDSAKDAEVPSVASDDYHGEHRPPSPEDGAAAFDLTMNGIYPSDVYGPRGAMEYGQGDEATARKIIALHNRPDAWVWIYRALPKGVPLTTHTAFRPGDWVTTDRDYAVEHGESNLGDVYGIARKRVKASEIFTNGDSLHEWGYWPQDKTKGDAGTASKEAVTEREAPSFRKPSTPEFKAWFGRSKCTQVQYHTTPADFDEFDTGRSDLGAHFGSLEQATKRATILAGRPGDAWSTMPCWLSIQNPLRLKDDGSFHADAIVWQLAKKGIITRADAKQIEDAIYDDWETRKEYDPKMVDAIKKAGYDGIVYKNEHEGAGDSWIVFDPNQIKSAIGNSGSFDPNSGKVTDAVHADIAVETLAQRLA